MSLTLNGHTLLWLSLEPQREEIALIPEVELSTLSVRGA